MMPQVLERETGLALSLDYCRKYLFYTTLFKKKTKNIGTVVSIPFG